MVNGIDCLLYFVFFIIHILLAVVMATLKFVRTPQFNCYFISL
ncbi:hypothetical protein SLEP1_g9712 [Rubroshorea leprosula]|uniref:Uncharacterized protein n=1 Tax=Rubroshorea leprosula TaxID=152421 RepID=A0AAV5I5R4_9ROSI|nr:hypothetical protein SLEP1_g9712 [Rubroshorea leprosula]